MACGGSLVHHLLVASIASLVLLVQAEEEAAVAIMGKSHTFDCGLPSANGIKWLDNVYNMEPNKPALIFDSAAGGGNSEHPIDSRLAVDDDFRLTITDLMEDDAGLYFCQGTDDAGEEVTRTYYLTLGREPECSGETEDKRSGDQVMLSCEMSFTGSETPVLEWFADSDMVDSTDEYSIMLAKQTVKLEVEPSMDKVQYTCRATFGDKVEECGFTMEVKYAVQDLTVVPEEEIRVGEDIMCSASGNPVPEVTMTMGEGTLQSAPSLVSFKVTPEMLDQTIEVDCSATNTLDGADNALEVTHTLKVIEDVEPVVEEEVTSEDDKDLVDNENNIDSSFENNPEPRENTQEAEEVQGGDNGSGELKVAVSTLTLCLLGWLSVVAGRLVV